MNHEMKEIIINNEQDMIALGEKIGSMLWENSVVALSGDLGAGKTTFTKGIGKALGIPTVINSPTFTILKIHQGKMPLYHMDVYRINKNSGDDDLEEFFEKGGVTVVEWAENIDYLLPDEYLKINIKDLGNNRRLLQFSGKGGKYMNIIERAVL